MKKLLLLNVLLVSFFFTGLTSVNFDSQSQNKSPESLVKSFIKYAQDGDFLKIISNLNYYNNFPDKTASDEKKQNVKRFLEMEKKKQFYLIEYYKDKYKDAVITKSDKISNNLWRIFIKSYDYTGQKTILKEEPILVINIDGNWYIYVYTPTPKK
jgi:hypothetical protein